MLSIECHDTQIKYLCKKINQELHAAITFLYFDLLAKISVLINTDQFHNGIWM